MLPPEQRSGAESPGLKPNKLFLSYKESRDYFRKELKSGQISPDLVEAFKIATPEGTNRYDITGPQQREFEEYMQGITNKLLDNEFARKYLLQGKDIPRFRYFVSGSGGGINASIVTQAEPPFIFFTRGLLEKFSKEGTEDELAGFLAHEITHHFINSKKDTKIEEGVAYALPRFMLYYGGYQHTGLAEAFNKIDNPGFFGHMFSYFDVHPGPDLTKRVIDDSEGFLAQFLRRRQRGFRSIPFVDPTPVPPRVAELVSTFDYKNVVEADFAAAGLLLYPYVYDEKAKETGIEPPGTTKKKLEFITEHFDEWLDTSGKVFGPIARQERLRSVTDVLQNHVGEHSSTKFTPEDLTPLINKVITSEIPLNIDFLANRFPRINEHRDSEYFRLKWAEHYVPEGSVLADIRDAFTDVFKLTSSRHIGGLGLEDTIAKCRTLREKILQVPLEHRTSLNYFYFGEMPNLPTLGGYLEGQVYDIWEKRFKARQAGQPEPEGFNPPWEKLVEVAQREYKTKRQTSVAEALLILGVTDPRLATLPAHNPVDMHYGKHYSYMNLGYPVLMQDEKGKIIGTYSFWRHYMGHITFNERNLETHRKNFYKLDQDNLQALGVMEKPIINRINGLQIVEDLYELMTTYPLHLAFPNRFLGAVASEGEQIPGSEIATALTVRLEILLKKDPSAWVPIVKEIFGSLSERPRESKNTAWWPASLHDLVSVVGDGFLDHVLSGSHDYFRGKWNQKTGDSEEIKIYLPDEIGMALNHPYLDFVLRHTPGMNTDNKEIFFSKEEALSVLDRAVTVRVRTLEGTELTPPEILGSGIYLRLIGEKDLAKSDSEMAERLARLRRMHPSVAWPSGHDKVPGTDEWASRFLLLHARHEAFNWLNSHPDQALSPEAFSEIAIANRAKVGDYIYSDFETGKAYFPEIENLLEKQFLINAKSDLAKEEHNASQLALAYTLYEKYGYFREHPELRWGKGYDRLITRQLGKLREASDPVALRSFAETILYGCNVQSPELRESLVSGWSEALRRQYGIDRSPAFNGGTSVLGGESAYQQKILAIADEVTAKVPFGGLLHEAMLEALTNELETQSVLTRQIFSRKTVESKEQIRESNEDLKGTLKEFGLDLLTNDEKIRPATIDFLTTHLTEKSLEEYTQAIDRRIEEIKGWRDYDDIARALADLKTFFQSPLQRLSEEELDLKDQDTRRRAKGRFRAAYENFWEARIEVRAYYMSLLAFPSREVLYGSREDREKAAAYVINKVLPSNEEEPKDSRMNRYTTFGRDLIYSYLEGATNAEKRLLLSGLMVSARSLCEVQERDETTIGRALAMTLSNMGPAGVKLAQAVHSYPQTPEPIRNGMEGVKGEANIPDRQQLFDRLESVVPATNGNGEKLTLDKISHVGEVIGAGAYQFTARVHLQKPFKNYEDVALTLLREHIYTFAQNEYEHIRESLDTFVKRRQAAGDQVGNTTVQAMRQVINQARAMSKLETDYNTGAEQARIIGPQYDGLTIRAGGRTVGFTTVDWLDYGTVTSPTAGGQDVQAYVALSIAPGASFNKFSKTAKEKELRDLGLALQVSEDIMTLSGRHFDHDRHGENFNVLRVERETPFGETVLRPGDLLVTHYDLGTVNLNPPTAKEKAEIGQIIAASLQSTLQGSGDIRAVLVREITDRLANNPERSDYLSSVLRGLLARGDFLRRLDQNDVKNAAIALFQSGTIDGEIMGSIFQSLTNNGGGLPLSSAMNILGSENPAVWVQTLPKVFQR